MDNKTQSFQFRKTKLALAVAMTVSLAACGVDGDEGSTSTSNSTSSSQTDATQNTVDNQQLKGNVTGIVTDTNGNPIAGADVYLAGMHVQTDAGGIYLFEDVDVVAVNGVNNEGGEVADPLTATLPVTIMATGHLGGTVYVTPKAQVNNTGGQGSGQNGSNSTTTVQTYIDGFLANAGTAELPALTANVVAYLKDCSIDTDGDGNHEAPAVGVSVAFDVTNVLDGATSTTTSNGDVAGSDFILAVNSPFTAVSDANGMVSVMLPADSTARFLADGWTLDAVGGTSVLKDDVTTENEGITTHLGDVVICKIGTTSEGPAPKTDPQVVSVDGEYTVNGAEKTVNPGGAFNRDFVVLSEGVVNNFKVNFNTALVGLDGKDSELVVTLNGADAPAGTTVTLADDLMSATIAFPADLDPEDKVDLFIPEWMASDADGERVGEDGVHEGKDFIDEGFDVGGGTKVSTYTRVSFCIFSVPDASANIDLIEQIIDADTAEDASFAALSEYSDAFRSNIDGTGTVEQLNGEAATASRLDALAEEILRTTNGGTGTSVAIDVNDARVSYADKAGVVTVTDNVGTLGAAASGVFEVEDTGYPNTVTATASNIFGVVKGTDSVVVDDKIAPTTVLQENYNITALGAPKANLPMTTTSQTVGVTFGEGGEATNGQPFVAGTVGNPLIYVQPRLLVARGSDITTASERGNEFDALTEDMNDRRDSGETTIDLRSFADRPLYDRTAIADEWGAVAQQIGVAMSENTSIVNGVALGTADISTSISAPTAYNNVTANVDNGATTDTTVDLVGITVADVVNLANNDIGGVVSFAGVIQDERGNVARPGRGDVDGENAQVIFQDAFPPMVESAEWNGTTFTIVFNENVAVPTGTDTLDLHLVDPLDATNATKQAIQLDAGESNVNAEGYFTYNSDTHTLVVNVSTGIETQFKGSSTADEELFYNDDIAANSTQEQHAVLNWDSLEDTSGNNWLEFNGGALTNGIEVGDTTLAGNDRWEVNAPQFLAVNTLGQLNVNLDFDPTTYNKRLIGAIADSDDAVTLLLTSTYAIDLDATFSLAGFTNASMPSNGTARLISGTDIAALLQEGDFTINTGSSTGTVSPDRRTITFNIVVNGPLATDLIEAGDTVQIDNAVLNVNNQATDTLSRDDAIQQLVFN